MSDQDPPAPPPALGRAAHNERRKLLATTVNAVGLAIFAVGAIQPFLSAELTTRRVLAAGICVIVFAAMHLAAQWLLKALQD